jgi:hypothetical protein
MQTKMLSTIHHFLKGVSQTFSLKNKNSLNFKN